ncbi:hypothetical protein CSUB01_10959 [Colletotrichum sublineola]|uniref:Uncharacterized protein n=1 Tax=Colletotrichum sublineola TaxID=1173701 RepID=A0A066XIE5_COLSU|nr:hypothetical protein CSUB01_10959 [Colletotrichum sublineola]
MLEICFINASFYWFSQSRKSCQTLLPSLVYQSLSSFRLPSFHQEDAWLGMRDAFENFTYEGLKGTQLDWDKHQPGLQKMTEDFLDKNGHFFWPDDNHGLVYSRDKELIKQKLKELFYATILRYNYIATRKKLNSNPPAAAAMQPTTRPAEITYDSTQHTARPAWITYDSTQPTTRPVEITYDSTQPTARPAEITYDSTQPITRPAEITYDSTQPTTRPAEITHDYTPTEATSQQGTIKPWSLSITDPRGTINNNNQI